MALKNPRSSRYLAYLAYRLGNLPFRLLEAFNMWDYLRSPRQSAWERVYERVVIEGQETIKSCQDLVGDLPGRLADAAREALTARWENLKKHKRWDILIPIPRLEAKLKLKIREDEATLDTSLLPPDAEWKAFSDAITAFWTAFPEPICDFAALGSAIADFLTLTQCVVEKAEVVTIAGRKRLRWEIAPVERYVPATFRLQTILAKMAEDHQVLIGLEVDLSLQAWESGLKYRYLRWAEKDVKSVHRAIIERLRPPRSALEIVPTWIPAAKAEKLAEDFKVPLSLSNISKLARKQPPLFDARTRRNRLYIRLDSFVKFLWERRERTRTGGATDEEAAEAIEQHKKQRGRPNLD
jgi:hypothetical protein